MQFWASFWNGWSDAVLKKDQKPNPEPAAPEVNETSASLHSLRDLGLEPDFSTVRAEFLANMNHDLRTPLNAVIGFAQIIESEIYGQVGPQYLEYAKHIQESGYDLLAKIEELLALAESEKAEKEAEHRSAPARRLAVAE